MGAADLEYRQNYVFFCVYCGGVQLAVLMQGFFPIFSSIFALSSAAPMKVSFGILWQFLWFQFGRPSVVANASVAAGAGQAVARQQRFGSSVGLRFRAGSSNVCS